MQCMQCVCGFVPSQQSYLKKHVANCKIAKDKRIQDLEEEIEKLKLQSLKVTVAPPIVAPPMVAPPMVAPPMVAPPIVAPLKPPPPPPPPPVSNQELRISRCKKSTESSDKKLDYDKFVPSTNDLISRRDSLKSFTTKSQAIPCKTHVNTMFSELKQKLDAMRSKLYQD